MRQSDRCLEEGLMRFIKTVVPAVLVVVVVLIAGCGRTMEPRASRPRQAEIGMQGGAPGGLAGPAASPGVDAQEFLEARG
jgi:hypothetical protein